MTLKDKLYKLRRDKGYSQEELAEKLDVSRQAVSKWERGESSPDTNNLIRIAKLYDIPVDELAGCIRGDASIPLDESIPGKTSSGISLKKPACAETMGIAGDFISLSVPDDDGEIYPQREPVQDTFTEPPPYAPQPSGTAYESSGEIGGTTRKKKRFSFKIPSDPVRAAQCEKLKKFPFWALMLLFFFFFGGVFDLWEFSWLFFLLIPLYYTSIKAYEVRNMNYFCYPLVAVTAFFGFSFLFDFLFGYVGEDIWCFNAVLWFLSIPLYYTGIAAYRHKKCKYFCFPVLVVMFYLLSGIFYEGFFTANLWLFALIPFYYVYSSALDKKIFGRKKK